MRLTLFNFLRNILEYFARTKPHVIDTLSREIDKTRGYGGGDEARLFIQCLDSLKLSTAPIIFDIGANVGKYSRRVLELSPRASIFAFEPSTVARGNFDPQLVSHTSVEIVPYAVSD